MHKAPGPCPTSDLSLVWGNKFPFFGWTIWSPDFLLLLSKSIQTHTEFKLNLWIISRWVKPSGLGNPVLNFWGCNNEGKPYVLQTTPTQNCLPGSKCLLCEKCAWSRRMWIWDTWVLSPGHWLVFWINLKVIYNCHGSIDFGWNVFSKKIKTKEFRPMALGWRQRIRRGVRGWYT